MIFTHSVQILCWILIVNATVQNVRAISFDDIFEYFLDAVDDSDELSDGLTNSNLNVTCKNCNVSVVSDNCTHIHRDTQSTLPIQMSTQNNQQITSSSSLPTPTIPAPDREPANVSSESIATETASTKVTAPIPSAATTNNNPEDASTQAASTDPIDNGDQVTDDGANADTNTSDDGITGETDSTTESNSS